MTNLQTHYHSKLDFDYITTDSQIYSQNFVKKHKPKWTVKKLLFHVLEYWL